MTALLFLTLLVLLAALARERRRRQVFAEDGGAFRCRVRAFRRRRWSRRMSARWCGGVLEIRRGPVLDRTVRLTARISPAGVFAVPSRDAPRRGRESIAIRLLVHDGSIVEVVTTETERTELVGPFLGAALSDLPQPPVRRREP